MLLMGCSPSAGLFKARLQKLRITKIVSVSFCLVTVVVVIAQAVISVSSSSCCNGTSKDNVKLTESNLKAN